MERCIANESVLSAPTQSHDAAPQPRGVAEAAAVPSGPATEAAATAATVDSAPGAKELPPDNNAIVYEALVVRVCGIGSL